jgi:hypothetical protein
MTCMRYEGFEIVISNFSERNIVHKMGGACGAHGGGEGCIQHFGWEA